MKVKDIARANNLDRQALEDWIKQAGYMHKTTAMGGLDVDDSYDVNALVVAFKQVVADRERAAQERAAHQQQIAQQEEASRQQAAREKQQALAGMLITSGFTFDGYTITKYSGYISGDDVVQIPRGSGGFFGGNVTDVGAKLMESLVHIRRNALVELKESAYALGCNAVIGVDFDYLTLDPQTSTNAMSASNVRTIYLPYVFGVTANGNAVVIEKNGPPTYR